jgi:hypothetical protein
MTNTNSPLKSALYPASMEAEVIANLESQGYTILMVENLG